MKLHPVLLFGYVSTFAFYDGILGRDQMGGPPSMGHYPHRGMQRQAVDLDPQYDMQGYPLDYQQDAYPYAPPAQPAYAYPPPPPGVAYPHPQQGGAYPYHPTSAGEYDYAASSNYQSPYTQEEDNGAQEGQLDPKTESAVDAAFDRLDTILEGSEDELGEEGDSDEDFEYSGAY